MYLANGLIKPYAREELKAFVRDRLEPYKHPREVIFVESLPTMHLGKVDLGRSGRHRAPVHEFTTENPSPSKSCLS